MWWWELEIKHGLVVFITTCCLLFSYSHNLLILSRRLLGSFVPNNQVYDINSSLNPCSYYKRHSSLCLIWNTCHTQFWRGFGINEELSWDNGLYQGVELELTIIAIQKCLVLVGTRANLKNKKMTNERMDIVLLFAKFL